MTRIIPNEHSYIAYVATIAAATTLVPTAAEIAGGTDLTPFVTSLNASSRGNVVATPSFDSLFETSIVGTSTATFEMDCYRDDSSDTAWTTLTRGKQGYIVISRFGGAGVDPASGKTILPIIGDIVEVWPIIVVSRASANMTNNTAQTFTVTASVPREPNEAATITA